MCQSRVATSLFIDDHDCVSHCHTTDEGVCGEALTGVDPCFPPAYTVDYSIAIMIKLCAVETHVIETSAIETMCVCCN